ncbi:hypothetical protein F5884DRAFT_791118 [Xylogone sp. PMI_703]|nr:hypothetical protein F5884DRAFT_791118 [Xylogone sp. PMI_703]
MAPLSPSPLFKLLTPILQSFRLTSKALPSTTIPNPLLKSFSTSPSLLAGGGKKGKPKRDNRVTLIRYHLQHPQTPRPLRLSRLRALRHWTIHRAWLLTRRKTMEKEQTELQRMYQSMSDACEELRLLDPPGTKDAGRLYRIAMEKKGIFGHGGVPIEYARHQTETPGKVAWNHAWTR